MARGVGLGLSIAERIARVLNSELTVKSVVGRGSRFAVTVPRAAAIAPAIVTHARTRADAGRLGGTVALCIDNDRAILEATQELLHGWNCRVLTAVDLATALAVIESSGLQPDGLLVDYHLDDGDGIAAVAVLRQHLGRRVPAILITADYSAEVRELAKAEGLHLVNKPAKPASMRALIAQWRIQRVAAE